MDRRKMQLVNQETITAPVQQGGLGILDLGDMRTALAAKLIFNYANN